MIERMEKKVLVLNLDHTPMAVVTVQKALVLTLLEKATSLANFDYLRIRTVDREFFYPAVIQLYEYKNVPYKGVMLNRVNLYKRDHMTCQYCGSKKNLTIDHVVPKSKGGKTNWNNLVTACHRCNTLKGNKTLEQVGLKLTRQPFKPSLDYFLAAYAERHAEEWLPFLHVKAL